MILFLGHTQPEIASTVHRYACYTFESKQAHNAALRCIGCYLKGILDMGLILDPDNNYNIDCYPDTDFSCFFGHAHPQDPYYVRSWTAYLICLAGCPVILVSKVQTEVALSPMES